MIQTIIDGIPLEFHTSPSLFSPFAVDSGTLAMLSTVDFTPEDYVLDLGCGYGAVGIYAAKKIGAARVLLTDVDSIAVEAATENALRNGLPELQIIQSNGFKQIEATGFTYILSHPPYHSDFSVAKHFIEKGFNRLAIGGRLVMVTKRRTWYKNKLIAIFGGVEIDAIDGYFVFTAQRRTQRYANRP